MKKYIYVDANKAIVTFQTSKVKIQNYKKWMKNVFRQNMHLSRDNWFLIRRKRAT